MKPIRLQINYILSSKTDQNIVPPILDPANSTFDYNVRKNKFSHIIIFSLIDILQIPIQKDCGYDDICVPNLHLSTSK